MEYLFEQICGFVPGGGFWQDIDYVSQTNYFPKSK